MELQRPSLLMLNDDCLMEVSKYLVYHDYINFAKTCSRLRAVASKYKKIHVVRSEGDIGQGGGISFLKSRTSFDFKKCNKMLKHVLLKLLRTVGEHVLSVKITGTDLIFFEILTERCKNLQSVNVNYEGPIPFKNLIELKFGSNVTVTRKQLKRCAKNNPDIQSLEYNGVCDMKFLKVLKMLPKLRSLKVKDVYTYKSCRLNQRLLNSLETVMGLTAFSFRSNTNRNQFLIGLGQQLHLLKLELYMPCNEESLNILQSFRYLEELSMNIDEGLVRVVQITELPIKLKYIRLDDIKISCSTFLSLIKQMKFLREFDIRSTGHIFADNDKSKYFPKPFPTPLPRIVPPTTSEMHISYLSTYRIPFDAHITTPLELSCLNVYRINEMLCSVIDNDLRSDKRMLKLLVCETSWPKEYLPFQRKFTNLKIEIDRDLNGRFDAVFER